MKKILFALIAVSFLFVSCKKESDTRARAVLTDVSFVDFPATGSAEQTIQVFADADWVSEAPEWMTVTPSTGTGSMTVKITATDNIAPDGKMDSPRKGTLVFKGATLISTVELPVTQAGDKYRGLTVSSVTDVAKKADGEYVAVATCQVVAVNGNAYVLSDGTTQIYVTGDGVKPGDQVTLNGEKETHNGVPAIKTVENLSVSATAAPVHPTAVDITETLASYTSTSVEYVTITGEATPSGKNVQIKFEGVNVAAQLVNPGDELLALEGHEVVVYGYFIGKSSNTLVDIMVASYEDKGIKSNVLFQDDFEWLEPWSAAAGAGNDVGENVANTDAAPNIFGTAELSGIVDELVKRGYGYVWGWKGQDWSDGTPDNGNKRTLYLQRNYLKFGKTSYSSGLILPALDKITGTMDIDVLFDWCFSMTGANKPDVMTLTLTLSGGGTFESTGTETSDEVQSGQPTDGDLTKLEWQHPQIRIKGATSQTRITIRPTNSDPMVTNPTRKQNRWYLDNIKVVPAEGSSPGGGGEGGDAGAAVLPVEWTIQIEGHNYATTWPLANGSATEEGVSGYIASTTGTGTIWYNNEAGNTADKASGKKKTKLDVQALDPRVTGAWPGDYCQFKVPGSVAAGKKVRITFETRTSATNPKYWKLIYQDGTDWKAACEVKKEKVEGADVEYTHAMNADGSTNIQVDATVTYASKTDNIIFRFVCQSAMGAGGEMLTAPNGGTWRLAVTDATKTDWQPRIQWGE